LPETAFFQKAWKAIIDTLVIVQELENGNCPVRFAHLPRKVMSYIAKENAGRTLNAAAGACDRTAAKSEKRPIFRLFSVSTDLPPPHPADNCWQWRSMIPVPKGTGQPFHDSGFQSRNALPFLPRFLKAIPPHQVLFSHSEPP
jgi:hypothetical protein